MIRTYDFPVLLGYIRTSTHNQSGERQWDWMLALMLHTPLEVHFDRDVAGDIPPPSRPSLRDFIREYANRYPDQPIVLRPHHLDRYFKGTSASGILRTWKWQQGLDLHVLPYVPLPPVPPSMRLADLRTWILELCRSRMVQLGGWKSAASVPLSPRDLVVRKILDAAAEDIRVLASARAASDPDFRQFAFACRAYGAFNPLLGHLRSRELYRDRDPAGWGKDASHYRVFRVVRGRLREGYSQQRVLATLQRRQLTTATGAPFRNRDAVRSLLGSPGYRAFCASLPPFAQVTSYARPTMSSGLYATQHAAQLRLAAGENVLLLAGTGAGKTRVALEHHKRLLARDSDHLTVFVAPYQALVQHHVARHGGLALVGPIKRASNQRALTRLAKHESGGLLFTTPDKLNIHGLAGELCLTVRNHESVLLVVDECDCALMEAEFREAYRDIGRAVRAINPAQTLCMTATAPSGFVRNYLQERLLTPGRTWSVVSGDLERPNLALEHLPVANINAKRATVVHLAQRHVQRRNRVLVIDSKIKYVKRLHGILSGLGLRVGEHHSGLPESKRRETLDGISAGDLDVVVSTSGFGRGLDLAFDAVIVNHIPPSFSQLQQFFGRCARDGRPGWCWWVTCKDDHNFLRYAIDRISRSALTAAAREYLVQQARAMEMLAADVDKPALRNRLFQLPTGIVSNAA